MLALPESRLQLPVPMPGGVALSVADEAQRTWSCPALAEGCASRTILTAAVAEGQLPLLTVHKKVLVPVFKDVTDDE